MATNGGARAIGMENNLGTIETGKHADMFLFEPRKLKSMPMHDPYATAIYSSSQENVDTTIVNGKIVYRQGRFACGIEERGLSDAISTELGKLRKQVADL